MDTKLHRYVESDGDNQKWLKIVKIVVETTDDKEQLLLASEYIHDCDIDTSYIGVNLLAHLYLAPDLIEVIKS